jgi:hypothetical protein
MRPRINADGHAHKRHLAGNVFLKGLLDSHRIGHDVVMKTRVETLLILFLFTARFCPAGQATNLLSQLAPVPPFPELTAAAKSDGFPLDGMAPSTNTIALSPGDSITALVTLHQKGNRRAQWLVLFQIVAMSNGPPSHLAKPVVLYNALGDKFEFPRLPATFQIRTIGPYLNSSAFWGEPEAKDKSARVTINGGFLGLGIDKAAAAVHRMTLAKQKTPSGYLYFSVTPKPPPNAEVATNRARAAPLRVTPEEARALAGFERAMTSYFTAVGETPNLETMLWKVVSLPSIWSMVRHAGVTAWIGFDVDDVGPFSLPSGWDLPTHSQVYTLPLLITLNQHDALNVTFFATEPHPPLLACGGIVGFLAQNPDDNENYLTFRVISARCGPGAAQK